MKSPLKIWLVALSLIPLGLSAAPTRNWTVMETGRDNGRRLSVVASPVPAKADASLITIEPAQVFQEMVGFGGALTDASAWALSKLPADQRLEVIRHYYDPQVGIGYTLARTHINSCDFSLNTWALDETPGDYDLNDFSLNPMRRWVLPLIHDAQDIAGASRFHLLASPWSPPAWMKTNNRMDDGGSLRPEYRDSWARYYVKFVQAMRDEEKIPIWALTVQNEPAAHQTWESCLYTPAEERDFVRDHLGPVLARAGLSGVKLLAWDHNRDLLEERASAVFGDPESAKYLWGTAIHWYVSEDYAASSRVHAAYPDKNILFTEGCVEHSDKIGRWDNGEHYATSMIGDFKNWVCGFIDWNVVLDERGGPNHVGNFCDAPVIVNTVTKEVRYQASYYYIAHFSKFVQPGSHRIQSQGGPTQLQSIAFANPDGSVVLVVMNTTDDATGFALALDGQSNGCTIPAHAIQTYVMLANSR